MPSYWILRETRRVCVTRRVDGPGRARVRGLLSRRARPQSGPGREGRPAHSPTSSSSPSISGSVSRGSMARSRTSSIVCTNVKVIRSRTSAGMSRRSFALPSRHNHFTQPGAIRGQHLFLHPADFERLAAQRDFAGHRHVATHAAATEHARDRQRDREAGTRPVLRNRTGGEVDVQVGVAELTLRRSAAALLRDRTYEYAASTDSRITSPSWPVTVSRPVPGILSASISISSPPFGVQARPVTTPTSGSCSVSSAANCGTPSSSSACCGVMVHGSISPSALRARALAQHGGDLPLEVAQPGLATVPRRDELQRVVGEDRVFLRQPMLGAELRNQVAPRDLHLLLRRVAGDANHLESVAQCGRECRTGCSRCR